MACLYALYTDSFWRLLVTYAKGAFGIRKGSIAHSKRGMERLAVRYSLRTILYILSPEDNLIVFSQVHNLTLFSISSSGKCLH
jgi:hypothetical protein